jgi:hypothetical protein
LRDLRIIQTTKIENNISKETDLEWKDVLSFGLCKSKSQILVERTWAKLCLDMRTLCPETTWLTITEDLNTCDSITISAIHHWLEALITTPEWPFPQQVTLMINGNKDHCFSILFQGSIAKLPFYIPPTGFSLSPWRTEHFSGWKLIQSSVINSNQIGEV